MCSVVLISDFAYYCMSQLKIDGIMACKPFSGGQLSKAVVNLADQWRTFNFHHFWTEQIEPRMGEKAVVNENALLRHCVDTCMVWTEPKCAPSWFNLLQTDSFAFQICAWRWKDISSCSAFLFVAVYTRCLLTDLILYTRPSNEKLFSLQW